MPLKHRLRAYAFEASLNDLLLEPARKSSGRLHCSHCRCPRCLPFPFFAGSPIIFGNTDAARNSRGRNKRLAIVPAGYSWASSPNQVGT